MRRTIAAGVAVALAGFVAAGPAPAGAPGGSAPPTVDCRSRTQVIGGAPAAGPHDLRLGRIYMSGLRRTGETAPASMFTPKPGKEFAVVKAPPVVDAGATTTLVVPAREHGRFRFEIARDTQPNVKGRRVTLAPCPRRAEVAGKPVGPRTPFVGGIQVTGPGCYTLRARPEAGEPVTRRVKLGVERCGET